MQPGDIHLADFRDGSGKIGQKFEALQLVRPRDDGGQDRGDTETGKFADGAAQALAAGFVQAVPDPVRVHVDQSGCEQAPVAGDLDHTIRRGTMLRSVSGHKAIAHQQVTGHDPATGFHHTDIAQQIS